MSEKEFVARNLKIKQKSTFDMAELYKVMYRWFSRHNYDFQEKEYLEKQSGESKQLEIGWYGARKISDYIKLHINVKFLVIGLKSAEVQVGNAKRKTNEGDVEMRFDAIVERDYEGKFEGNPTTKFLREFYDKYVIRTRLESYEQELHEEVYELMGEVKSFLNLFKFQKIQP